MPCGPRLRVATPVIKIIMRKPSTRLSPPNLFGLIKPFINPGNPEISLSRRIKLATGISTDCQLANFAKEATLATYCVTNLKPLQVVYAACRLGQHPPLLRHSKRAPSLICSQPDVRAAVPARISHLQFQPLNLSIHRLGYAWSHSLQSIFPQDGLCLRPMRMQEALVSHEDERHFLPEPLWHARSGAYIKHICHGELKFCCIDM